MERIILASNSPRRRELLEQVGIPFLVDTEEVSEDVQIADPAELVKELSLRKASAVCGRHPGEWILGADTVVYYDGEILGKPADRQEAFDMLAMLGGRMHRVITGVTLLKQEEEKALRRITFAEITKVWMYEHPRDVLKRYVDSGEPMDKAGAYGIQGRGAILVERIEGDYNNVVGLPAARLYRKLDQLR